jgi:hypothetical protein
MQSAINPRLCKSTKSDAWEIAYSERKDGKTISRRVSTRTANRVEAEAALTGFITGSDRIAVSMTSPLVTEVLDIYEDHILRERKGDTQQLCIKLLRKGFEGVRVCDLTPQTQFRYRETRDVQSGTLRRELGVLRSALGYCKKHQMLKGELPWIELPRASQTREIYLTRTEADHFLELAMAHSEGRRLSRLTRFVAIALMTAARTSAVRGLTWDRIDWDAGTINFQEPGEALHNKRRVIVPISKRLRPILEQAYQERKEKYVLDHSGEIKKTWRTWITKTPYAHVSPHDLRRTWATLAIQAGVSIVDTAAILGDTPEVVLRHYAKHVPGMARAAIDTF